MGIHQVSMLFPHVTDGLESIGFNAVSAPEGLHSFCQGFGIKNCIESQGLQGVHPLVQLVGIPAVQQEEKSFQVG